MKKCRNFGGCCLVPKRIDVNFGQKIKVGAMHLNLIRNCTYSRLDFSLWKVLSILGTPLLLGYRPSGIESLICLQGAWTLNIGSLTLWDYKKNCLPHDFSVLHFLWIDKCFGGKKQCRISDSLSHVSLYSSVLSHQIFVTFQLQYMSPWPHETEERSNHLFAFCLPFLLSFLAFHTMQFMNQQIRGIMA